MTRLVNRLRVKIDSEIISLMEDAQEVSVDNKDEGQKMLSKLEVFGLVTGIVGLVADTIGLVTFAAGVWGFTNDGGSAASGYDLFIIVTGLLLIYGWVALAWAITVRAIRRDSVPPPEANFDEKVGRSTAGIGFLLLPLAIIWFTIAFSGNSSPSPEVVSTKAAITPTSLVDQTPISSTPTAYTSSWAGDVAGLTMVTMFFVYPITGLGIFGSIVLLMPLVYKDLTERKATATECGERVKAYIEDHWDELEERISIEFERYNWIEVDHLQDLADLLEVPLGSIDIVLVKYAWTHPKEVKYGYLCDGTDYPISHWKVLVRSSFDLGNKYMRGEW